MKMKAQGNKQRSDADEKHFILQQQLEQLQDMRRDVERDMKQLRDEVASLDSKLSMCGDVSKSRHVPKPTSDLSIEM